MVLILPKFPWKALFHFGQWCLLTHLDPLDMFWSNSKRPFHSQKFLSSVSFYGGKSKTSVHAWVVRVKILHKKISQCYWSESVVAFWPLDIFPGRPGVMAGTLFVLIINSPIPENLKPKGTATPLSVAQTGFFIKIVPTFVACCSACFHTIVQTQ